MSKPAFVLLLLLVAAALLPLVGAVRATLRDPPPQPNNGPRMADARNLRTFSHAVKGHSVCPCQTCFMHNCSNCSAGWDVAKHQQDCQNVTNWEASFYDYTPGIPGILRLMWFTGDLSWFTFGDAMIRVYVDGETTASIQFTLYESHAMGFGWEQKEQKTWGTKQFGKGALFGGLYMTFNIPFQSSISITAELPEYDRSPGTAAAHGLYFIARGLHGMPNVLLDGGSIGLPAKSQLKLHSVSSVVPWKTQVVLANVSGKGGAVYLVTMLAESGNARFLEGKVHAELDGTRMTLSSGTEDYFLSAQYFDAGDFTFPNSGLNHLDLDCLDELGTCRVAAYRFHESDPIIFQKSMVLTWEVGDPFWKAHNTTIKFYTWVYEW